MKKILLLLILLTGIYSISYAQCTNTITGGIIESDQIICYNTVPAAILEFVAPGGISQGSTAIYSWEISETGIDGWTTISGQNLAIYVPGPAFTKDAYLRRVVTDANTPAPCNTAASNIIHITVRPELTAGIIGLDETLCAGSTPSAITETTASTGGTGTYTYQWQFLKMEIFPNFSNIAGATNSSYVPSSLMQSTSYRRITTSDNCGMALSNVITKSVTAPEVVTASINDPGQVCAGSMAYTFTTVASTTGTGTLSFQWFLGTTLVGTYSHYTYNPVVGDNGKTVSLVATTSSVCNAGPATSNIVTLNIVSATTPTVTISGNSENCEGLPITFTATSTGGGSTPTYQWYVVPSSSPLGTLGTPVGSNSTTFTSTSLTNGDRIYVELTSSLACLMGVNPFKSNEITMAIKPIPAPAIIEGDQTLCSPNSYTYHAIVGIGTTFQWFLDGILIPSATNNTYTAYQSGTYSIGEDNGMCSSVSPPVNLTVIYTPIANAGPDQYVFASSTVNLNASGGNEYSWVPSTYLSNTAIANPSLTADQTITYTVTVSDPSGTCSTTDDVTIYVSNATPGSFSTSITGPNPVMPGQQNAVYSVFNQTGFTYTWSITGGTIVSGQNTNSVTVDWDAPVANAFARTTSTSYSISVLETNATSQTKTTSLDINTISTSTIRSQAQSGINVFPNPTTGSFNIEMPESGVAVSYDILDLTGRSVGSGTFTSTGSDQQINADFGAGMYQVVLKYNNVVTCVRLSKVE